MNDAQKGKEVMQEFQLMRLRAYSNVSLKRPLTHGEYTEMMAIAEELGYKK